MWHKFGSMRNLHKIHIQFFEFHFMDTVLLTCTISSKRHSLLVNNPMPLEKVQGLQLDLSTVCVPLDFTINELAKNYASVENIDTHRRLKIKIVSR